MCDLDRDKISIRYFRFLPGFRKYCGFCDGSPAEIEPKKLLLKKTEKTVFVLQISFASLSERLLFLLLKGRCGAGVFVYEKIYHNCLTVIYFLLGSRYDPVN